MAIQVPSPITEPLFQPTSTTRLSIVVPNNPVLPLNAHSAAPVISPDAGCLPLDTFMSSCDAGDDTNLIRKLERQSHRKQTAKHSHRSRTRGMLVAKEGSSVSVEIDLKRAKPRRGRRARGTRDGWQTGLEDQGCSSGLIKLFRRKVTRLLIPFQTVTA